MNATYTAYYAVNGGTRFTGWASKSHNAALRNTRRFFSGQGYRAVRDESIVGHVVLRDKSGNRVVIDVERNA